MIDTENIWREYHGNLQRFIQRRIKDKAMAEDILQEVFLKIHSRISTLEDHSLLPGWLYQVTRNTVIDYYRHHRPEEELPEDPSDPTTSSAERAAQELAERCVRPFIEALPEPYREALILSELQGLTQKQLAERKGLSLSGAKSRVQRGRDKLKQILMACCHFQFDRRGSIVSYDSKRDSCKSC
jgi:RNA polymerase sigma-70 factor, ECF subfamily